LKEERIMKIVRKGYAKIAEGKHCCGSIAECCKSNASLEMTKKMGLTEEELMSIPEGSFSLGCGNPVAFAALKKGETVLDLGSGLGFDCFLAANKVGDEGKVIGVDMTPEMVYKARKSALKGNYKNVEFRLGKIENLPVADCSADVVISNCVINLSPNKMRVFKEAFRVLKPGGRLMVSDIVLLSRLPPTVKKNTEAYVSCVAGAIKKEEYINLIEKAGFQEVKVVEEIVFPLENILPNPAAKAFKIISIKVHGVKPSKNQ
jgi:arsenite methyltransferase